MKIYVKTNLVCTHEESEDKEFGHWNQDYDFNIEGVYTEKKESYLEEFDLQVQKGSKVYGLVLRYSDGDSFGSATGKGELVWLFSEYEFAERVYHEYMNSIKDDSIYLMLEVDDKQFKRTKMGNIVNGYFEALEGLEIQEYTVE